MATSIRISRLLVHSRSFICDSKLLTSPLGSTFSIRHHQVTGDSMDGKTTVTILNKDQDLLLINAFGPMGFRLNNNLMALGPIAIFPKTVLSWNVQSAEHINENSLSLFYLLEPKIDILVIGLGDGGNKLSDSVRRFLATKRLAYEVLPTDKACATFNFLNSEGRYVAGALIPPIRVKMTDDDLIDAQNRKRNLFLTDD